MMVFSRRQRHIHLLSVVTIVLVVFTAETTAARAQNILRLAHPHEIYHGKQGTLDPTAAARFAPPIVMLYDQLILQNVDGTLHPALAESWESDETGRIFSLTLRKNARFHNGKPLTSRDVVYTFRHILDPDARSRAVPPANSLHRVNHASPATAGAKDPQLTTPIHLR